MVDINVIFNNTMANNILLYFFYFLVTSIARYLASDTFTSIQNCTKPHALPRLLKKSLQGTPMEQRLYYLTDLKGPDTNKVARLEG